MKGGGFFLEIIKIVVLALVIVLPIRYFVFQPFIVRGVSMQPNFEGGEYLIVDEFTYHFRDPERGEIIVFKSPGENSSKFIKRVIGMPGETIKLKGNEVVINKEGEKKVLDESQYLESPSSLNSTKLTLEKNEYFVLGDNRSHSFDSSEWGALEENQIIGKVLLRLFPFSSTKYFPGPEY